MIAAVSRNVARFPIRCDRWYGVLSRLLGLPPSTAYAELDRTARVDAASRGRGDVAPWRFLLLTRPWSRERRAAEDALQPTSVWRSWEIEGSPTRRCRPARRPHAHWECSLNGSGWVGQRRTWKARSPRSHANTPMGVHRKRIAELATQERLPTMFPPLSADAEGLLFYGTNLPFWYAPCRAAIASGARRRASMPKAAQMGTDRATQWAGYEES